MLARTRLDLLSVVPLLVIVAVCAPAWAQIHGVAPSVTSFGFGGSNNPAPGIPASVTSLGPNGYGNGSSIFGGNCCFGPNFGLNFGPNLGPNFAPSHPPLFDRRRGHHHHEFPVGNIMPVYVPYAVPVAGAADETPEDEDADMDTTYSGGVPPVYERDPRYHDVPASREVASGPASATKTNSAPMVEGPPAPVAAQPPTVLVFKDGHKFEVQNYAIVGDTLFEFSDGRTHKIQLAVLDLPATQKANEDQGVDFQLPLQKAKNGKAK
jgi:hypothetical protein